MKSSYRTLHENVPPGQNANEKSLEQGLSVCTELPVRVYRVSEERPAMSVFVYRVAFFHTLRKRHHYINLFIEESKFGLCTLWTLAETAVHQMWWREDKTAESMC